MKKRPEGTGLYPHTDDKSTQARHHSYLCANMERSKSNAGWREIFCVLVKFIQCFMRALRSLYVNWETMLTSGWPPKSILLTRAGALMLPVWYPIWREPSTAATMEVSSGTVSWFWGQGWGLLIQQGKHIWDILGSARTIWYINCIIQLILLTV